MPEQSALRDVAAYIRQQTPSKENSKKSGEPLQEYERIVVAAFDDALLMLGRSGTELFHNAMKRVYGLDKEDIARKPGPYMSALKAMLDTACEVIQSYILRRIKESWDIVAMSIDDALGQLRKVPGMVAAIQG